MKTLQLARHEAIAALVPALLDSQPQRRIIAVCLRRESKLNPAMPAGSERCIGPMISFDFPSSFRSGKKIDETAAIEAQIAEFIETYTVRALAIILYCDDVIGVLRSGEILERFFAMRDRCAARLESADTRRKGDKVAVCSLLLCDFRVCIDVSVLFREAHRIVRNREVDTDAIRDDDRAVSLASLYGILFVTAYRHLAQAGKISAYSDLEKSLAHGKRVCATHKYAEKKSGSIPRECNECDLLRKSHSAGEDIQGENIGAAKEREGVVDTQDAQDMENVDSSEDKQNEDDEKAEKCRIKGEGSAGDNSQKFGGVIVSSRYASGAARAYREEIERKRTPSIAAWNFTCAAAEKIQENTALVKKITAEKVGVLAAQLHDQKIRDRVILYAVHPTIRSVASLSNAQLIRKMTEASSSPPNLPRAHGVLNILAFLGVCVPVAIPTIYGTMAYIQWWIGEGSKARASIDKISEDMRGISLVKLVEYALSVQLPPPWVDIQKE